jgi:hypothetical protein
MVAARLYYEAHITVEASDKVTWYWFSTVARSFGWRASKFDEDEVDDMSGSWFLSFRGKDLHIVKQEVSHQLAILRQNGLQVLRWKIEDTVMDSKHGDVEEQLLA